MSETWAIRVLRAGMKLQNKVPEEVPDSLKEAAGRKAKIAIEGKDGGEMYIRWTGGSLVEEPESNDIRNTFTLHSQTLLDFTTGELGAREAIAARLVQVSGDRSIYDQEDIIKIFEKLQQILIKFFNEQGGFA